MKADFKKYTGRPRFFDFVFFALLALSAAGKISAALHMPLNSDNSLPALVYYDLANNHNFSLRLWDFAVNSYLFTDLPVYLALGPVIGMSAPTLKIGALILFMLSVILMCWLAFRIFGARTALYAAGFLLAASPFFSSFALKPFEGARVGTVIFSLAAFLAADSMIRAKKEKRAGGRMRTVFPLAVLFAAVSLAVFSDPYALLFVAAAGAAYLGVRIFGGNRLLDRRTELALALTLAASLLTVRLLYAAAGSLDIVLLKHLVPFGLAPVKDWAGYSLHYCLMAAGLLNMNVLQAGLPWYEAALRISNAVLFTVVLINAIILTSKEKDGRRQFALAFFWAVWVLAGLAFVFKEEVVLDMQQARYLAPMIYPFSIFFAISLDGGRFPGKYRRTLIFAPFLLSALYGAGMGFHYKPDCKPNGGQIRLVRFLEQNGLFYGYADYWNAGILTLLSNDTVEVRSLQYTAKSNLLKPYVLNAKLDWYKPAHYEGRTFLIVAKSGQSCDYDRLYCSPKIVTGYFGAPEEVLRFEGKYIYVWPHNIVKRFWPSAPQKTGK